MSAVLLQLLRYIVQHFQVRIVMATLQATPMPPLPSCRRACSTSRLDTLWCIMCIVYLQKLIQVSLTLENVSSTCCASLRSSPSCRRISSTSSCALSAAFCAASVSAAARAAAVSEPVLAAVKSATWACVVAYDQARQQQQLRCMAVPRCPRLSITSLHAM